MGGSPVEFTDKTIIIINSKSGKGKTTLAHFLAKNKHIKVIPTDRFFTIENFNKLIKKYNSHSSGLKSILKQYQNTKLYHNIGQIGLDINKHHANIFVDYIKNIINKIFKNESIKLIIIEGETLRHERVYELLTTFIEINNYKLWNLK